MTRCKTPAPKRGQAPPFDPAEVIDSLHYERYRQNRPKQVHSAIAKLYYMVRPLMPVAVRKHLQKVHLNGWRDIPFPKWPVDRTADQVAEQLLLLALKTEGVDQIPFIWFWPNGATSCAVMTHDVETTTGRDFCSTLMDINDFFGIKASFQVVPERRYDVPSSYLSPYGTAVSRSMSKTSITTAIFSEIADNSLSGPRRLTHMDGTSKPPVFAPPSCIGGRSGTTPWSFRMTCRFLMSLIWIRNAADVARSCRTM